LFIAIIPDNLDYLYYYYASDPIGWRY